MNNALKMDSQQRECPTFELIDDAVYIRTGNNQFIYIDQSVFGELSITVFNDNSDDAIIDLCLP